MDSKRLLFLIQGELQRLTKYHVTTISFLVTVMWFLLLYFIPDSDILAMLLPFVLIIDATMMSIIFIGSIMFFEKTESTFSTMLVTPASNPELIFSKAIANTIHMVISSMAIVLVFYFVKDVEINWFWIIVSLVLTIFFHSLLGFVFSFHSKDFTTMLVNVMIYNFLFTIPAVLNFFNVVFKGEVWEHLLLITPVQSSIKLIQLGFGDPFAWKSVIALSVIILGTIFGYLFYVLPKFKTYAVKQSGV